MNKYLLTVDTGFDVFKYTVKFKNELLNLEKKMLKLLMLTVTIFFKVWKLLSKCYHLSSTSQNVKNYTVALSSAACIGIKQILN